MVGPVVGQIPVQVMVKDELIGREQEDAGTTADIRYGEAVQIGGTLACKCRQERTLHDSIDDVARCRYNAAALTHLRLVDDVDGAADDSDFFTEEQLVDFTQNLS